MIALLAAPAWAGEPELLGRASLRGGVERGTELVGYGTRAPFVDAEGAIAFEVDRLPWGSVGIGLGGSFARTTRGPGGELVAGPILRLAGGPSGVVVVGAGLGGAFGARPSTSRILHAWPAVSAEARAAVGPESHVGLAARAAPITTDGDGHRSVVADLWLGTHIVQLGVWGRYERRRTGDPARTYRSALGGLEVGAVF